MGISGAIGDSSLTDVMNGLASGRMPLAIFECARTIPLSDLDAFIELDDVLASLHRQYLDARQQSASARKEHGADSPMADIAAEREDSAWCAMQTRLMELRAQGDLMRCAQKMIWESERLIEERKQTQKDIKALDLFYRLEAARQMKKKNKTSAIYEWLIVIMLLEQFLKLPFPVCGPPQRMAA